MTYTQTPLLQALTSISGNAIITSLRLRDDSRTHTIREIIDTRNEQVIEALVKLGWTPPSDEK